MFHDAGMSKIPVKLITKPGKLTSEERFMVKKHPELGVKLLDGLPDKIVEASLYHHEAHGGGGYPRGLPVALLGSDYASVISISSAFDAMISERAYRSKKSITEAKLELVEDIGWKWDGRQVARFINSLARLGIE
jgi:HD-GYP domain-containing protein (c-di-GMP phosphodiesterase class II)